MIYARSIRVIGGKQINAYFTLMKADKVDKIFRAHVYTFYLIIFKGINMLAIFKKILERIVEHFHRQS